MRDLGRMGESAFAQWCASAGLTANSSTVDRTGWDFFVEFEFDSKENLQISTVHNAALECKVQVKSTDNNDRKLGIKLSNLKRLATAAMPAFIIFIEFDGTDSPQRVFLVHVNQDLSLKILSRLHDAEQQGASDLLHKKTMTIKYDETHLLAEISGKSLALAMRKEIGLSMSDYVAKKNAHLSSAGFDDGFAEITFTANGVGEISKLIDMSIGLESDAGISELVGFKKRFGKISATPFLSEKNVKLGMPDLKPTFEGTLNFKADKIGSSFSFFCTVLSVSVQPQCTSRTAKRENFDRVF